MFEPADYSLYFVITTNSKLTKYVVKIIFQIANPYQKTNKHQYNSKNNEHYYTYTKMNYDDILEELGELGPWQFLHCLLLWLPSVASGICVLIYSFSGTKSCNT